MSTDVSLDDLPTLRTLTLGLETVHHLQDGSAYRTLCERFFEAGYDFPQCLSGVDMEYGLRTVVNLRRLDDGAEVTLWLDVPYDAPQVPTVSDLWGGLEWHEREAYDLLGIPLRWAPRPAPHLVRRRLDHPPTTTPLRHGRLPHPGVGAQALARLGGAGAGKGGRGAEGGGGS